MPVARHIGLMWRRHGARGAGLLVTRKGSGTENSMDHAREMLIARDAPLWHSFSLVQADEMRFVWYSKRWCLDQANTPQPSRPGDSCPRVTSGHTACKTGTCCRRNEPGLRNPARRGQVVTETRVWGRGLSELV